MDKELFKYEGGAIHTKNDPSWDYDSAMGFAKYIKDMFSEFNWAPTLEQGHFENKGSKPRQINFYIHPDDYSAMSGKNFQGVVDKLHAVFPGLHRIDDAYAVEEKYARGRYYTALDDGSGRKVSFWLHSVPEDYVPGVKPAKTGPLNWADFKPQTISGWIDPSGKFFKFSDEDQTHADWIHANQKILKNHYGISLGGAVSPQDFKDLLLSSGWIRVRRNGFEARLGEAAAMGTIQLVAAANLRMGQTISLNISGKDRTALLQNGKLNIISQDIFTASGWIDPAGKFHNMGKDAHVSWLQKYLGKSEGGSANWDAMISEAYGQGWARVECSGGLSFYYSSDIAISNAERYIEDNIPRDKKVIIDLEDRGHKFINLISEEAWNGNLKSLIDFQLKHTMGSLKRASVLDYARPSLPLNIWNIEDGTYVFKPELKGQIISKIFNTLRENGMKDPSAWIIDIHILGSCVSVLFTSRSDLDCHIDTALDVMNFVEFDGKATPEQMVAFLTSMRKIMNDEQKAVLRGTEHPLEIFFEAFLGDVDDTEHRNYLTHATAPEGLYSLTQDRWLKPPVDMPKDYDPESAIPKEIWQEVRKIIGGLDISLGKMRRAIQSIEDLQEAIKDWEDEGVGKFKKKLEEKLESLDAEIEDYIRTTKTIIDERHEHPYATMSRENVVFKAVQRFNYLRILRALEPFAPDTHVTEEDVPEIKEILENPNPKSQANRQSPVNRLSIPIQSPSNPSLITVPKGTWNVGEMYAGIGENEEDLGLAGELGAGIKKVSIRPSIYMTDRQAFLVWSGKKTKDVRARMMRRYLNQERYLCSRWRAYGIISLEEPEVVDLDGFHNSFGEHLVTDIERERWWPGITQFYLYSFSFKPFRVPRGWTPPIIGRVPTERQIEDKHHEPRRPSVEVPKEPPSPMDQPKPVQSSLHKLAMESVWKVTFHLPGEDYVGYKTENRAKAIKDVAIDLINKKRDIAFEGEPYSNRTKRFMGEWLAKIDRDWNSSTDIESVLVPAHGPDHVPEPTKIAPMLSPGESVNKQLPLFSGSIQNPGLWIKGPDGLHGYVDGSATAGAYVASSLERIALGLSSGWIAPDGRYYDTEDKSHGIWAVDNKEMLRNKYRIEIDMLADFDAKALLADSGSWVRVMDGGFQFMVSDTTLGNLNNFIIKYQKSLPNEIFIDTDLGTRSLDKSFLIENGLVKSMRIRSSLGAPITASQKVASDVFRGWLAPDGQFFPVNEGEHYDWIRCHGDMLLGHNVKPDIVSMEDAGWIRITRAGVQVNDMAALEFFDDKFLRKYPSFFTGDIFVLVKDTGGTVLDAEEVGENGLIETFKSAVKSQRLLDKSVAGAMYEKIKSAADQRVPVEMVTEDGITYDLWRPMETLCNQEGVYPILLCRFCGGETKEKRSLRGDKVIRTKWVCPYCHEKYGYVWGPAEHGVNVALTTAASQNVVRDEDEFYGWYNGSQFIMGKNHREFPGRPAGNWFQIHTHPLGQSGSPSEVDLVDMVQEGRPGPDYSLGDDGLWELKINDMSKAKTAWSAIQREHGYSGTKDLAEAHGNANRPIDFESIKDAFTAETRNLGMPTAINANQNKLMGEEMGELFTANMRSLIGKVRLAEEGDGVIVARHGVHRVPTSGLFATSAEKPTATPDFVPELPQIRTMEPTKPPLPLSQTDLNPAPIAEESTTLGGAIETDFPWVGKQVRFHTNGETGTILGIAPSDKGGTPFDFDLVIRLDKPVFGHSIIEAHPMEIELVGEDPSGGLFVLICRQASFTPGTAVNAPENNRYQNKPDDAAHNPWANPDVDEGETVLPLLKKKRRPLTVKDIEDMTTNLEEYHVEASVMDVYKKWYKKWRARKGPVGPERNTTWPVAGPEPLKRNLPSEMLHREDYPDNSQTSKDGLGEPDSMKDDVSFVKQYVGDPRPTPGMF